MRKPLTKRLDPDPVVLLHSVLVAHPLQKILYSDHAIRIYCDLQYELRLCVALSFLSSHWCSGNIMPRIPITVGSIKSWDATLTQTVRVGCSELHSQNEFGLCVLPELHSWRSGVARVPLFTHSGASRLVLSERRSEGAQNGVLAIECCCGLELSKISKRKVRPSQGFGTFHVQNTIPGQNLAALILENQRFA